MRKHPAPTTEPPVATTVRVLVADDDPASCRFLGDGLQTLGAQVTLCHSGGQALARACTEAYDLLLLDCRMPDLGGPDLLAALHRRADAASATAVAVASSAEGCTQLSPALSAAGFVGALPKPCTLAQLGQMLQLAPGWHGHGGTLDDTAGLRSSGDQHTLQALRQLLRDELEMLDAQLPALANAHADLVERLHRLRASCGFCGAPELSDAAAVLQGEACECTPSGPAIARFRAVLRATQQALRAS